MRGVYAPRINEPYVEVLQPMAKRNPLAAKMHAANVRERKKRDALSDTTFVPIIPRPIVCSVPPDEV